MPTPEELDRLRELVAGAEEADKRLSEELRLAEMALVPVDDIKAKRDEVRRRITRIKSVYKL